MSFSAGMQHAIPKGGKKKSVSITKFPKCIHPSNLLVSKNSRDVAAVNPATSDQRRYPQITENDFVQGGEPHGYTQL